jgi:hypothetical protein
MRVLKAAFAVIILPPNNGFQAARKMRRAPEAGR